MSASSITDINVSTKGRHQLIMEDRTELSEVNKTHGDEVIDTEEPMEETEVDELFEDCRLVNHIVDDAADNEEQMEETERDDLLSDTAIDSEEHTEETEGDDNSNAPIDRGWAWVVLGGCVFEIIIYGGLVRSFGVFFLQYQMRFHSNASETALMSLIQNLCISITALFVMTIGLQKFSSRVSVCIGGVLTVLSYLITAFTTDIGVFYFVQGVIGGMGMAFTHPPMFGIIGVYFKKHRGLANSIFTGGASVGGLIFAPIVVKLFEEYQFTGTMLIVSGLLMNIFVAALLMRPIESYTKTKPALTRDNDTETLEPALTRDNDTETLEPALTRDNDTETLEPALTRDNDTETLEPALTRDNDTETLEPALTRDNDTETLKPALTRDNDTETLEPALTRDNDTETLEPALTRDNDTETLEPSLTRDNDTETLEPALTRDNDTETLESALTRDNDTETLEPALTRDNDTETLEPALTRDNDTETLEQEQLLLQEDDTTQCNADVDLHKADTESTQKEFGIDTTGPIDHTRTTQFVRMHTYDPTFDHHNQHGSPLLHRIRAHSVGRRQTSDNSNHIHKSITNLNRSNGVLNGVMKSISKSQVVVCASMEAICGSVVDINTTVMNHTSNGQSVPKAESKLNNDDLATCAGCCFAMKSCVLSVLSTVFDIALLRNPVFLTFLLMAFSIMSGVALLPVFIPTYAHDIGISNERIGLILSIMAAVDLVAKITMGVVADRKLIKRSTILIVVTFVLGTTSQLARFVNSFPSMLFFAIVAGLCCGQYMAMYAVLLMEIIGPEKFRSSLGFGTLVHGTSIAVFFPIAGLLRDVTGSYVASFHLLGGLSYLAGVLAFVIPIVHKWKIAKDEHESKTVLIKV